MTHHFKGLYGVISEKCLIERTTLVAKVEIFQSYNKMVYFLGFMSNEVNQKNLNYV